jgi:hypothetical protein
VAARRDLEIYQGDTFTHEIRIVDADGDPINVSGKTFESQVRRRSSYDTIEATFSVDMTNAATGVVVFTIDAATCADLETGVHRYDVQQIVGGVVLTLVFGRVDVRGEVTR